MKKLKLLLSSLLACVLAFSLAGCSANCGGDDGPTDEPGDDEVVGTLFNIEVDTSAAKTEYFCGDEFTSEGLVVTSYIRTGTGTGSITQTTLEADQYTVDSSAFNTEEAGTYTITVSYTYGDVTRDAGYSVTVVEPVRVSRLVIDTTGARTIFNNGDEFSAEGLVVTAIDTDYRTNTDLTPYDVTDDIVIDSAAYDADTDGDYTIGVSYTKEGTTVETSYTVKVMTAAGLKVVLPTDETTNAVIDTYDYVTAGTEIDITDIEVYEADANGVADDAQPLDKANLTFKAYRGHADNEYTITNNIFTADQTGAYTIEAVYEDYVLSNSETTDLIGFAIVYVVDELKSLGFAGGTTTQTAGADVMSDTWTFTATYASGATKTLTAEEVEIEGVNTIVAGSGTATVTYTEQDCKGSTMTATCNVNYTVTEAQGSEALNVIIGSTEISALSATMTEETKINDYVSVMANAGSTVTVDANSKTYSEDSSKTYTHRLKLGGTGTIDYRSVKITTVADNATIIVYALSSSSSADRALGLFDGTFTKINEGTAAGKPTTNLSKIEFTAATAGTYYLASTSGGINIYGIEIYNPATEVKADNVIIGSTEISALSATMTEETKINDYVSVMANAGSTVTVDANSKTYSEDSSKTYTHRLKLGGTGTIDYRSVKITTVADNATIIVYALSSSSSADRALGLFDGTFTKINEGTAAGKPTTNLSKIEFTAATAGTYYLASTSGGINIYGIEIIYS